jgi:hypothetical protein
MDHRSAAPRRSGLTIRSVSLALALVSASLALVVAVHGAGGADTAPVASLARAALPVTHWGSWIPSTATASAAAPTASPAPAPPAASLTIQGTPPAGVNYDSPYSFTPTVSGPARAALAFAIQNKPAWAAFNSSNGALTGTPGAADVGTDANIVISVSDGTSTTSLGAFSISVNEFSGGAATLNWSGVTQTLADTTLPDLAGYVVYYGTSADNLNRQVKLANPGLTSYVVTDLASGTWYFRIAAYTSSGIEGVMSSVVQKTIP